METSIGPQQIQEIMNLGKEFAFEGLDMRYFKTTNPDELRYFKEGYEEGLAIIRQKQKRPVIQPYHEENTIQKSI